MVLLDELRHRLDIPEGPRLTLFSFFGDEERALLRSHHPQGSVATQDARVRHHALASPRGGDASLASAGDFDVLLVHSLPLAVRGLYPSLDPFRSSSRLLRPEIAGAEHCELAERALRLLRESDPLVDDGLFLECVANRAFAAARDRARALVESAGARLAGEARVALRRALLLRSFLTTPFFTAEGRNGFAGRHVPLAATLDGCRAILAGGLDDREPDALMWGGALDG